MSEKHLHVVVEHQSLKSKGFDSSWGQKTFLSITCENHLYHLPYSTSSYVSFDLVYFTCFRECSDNFQTTFRQFTFLTPQLPRLDC